MVNERPPLRTSFVNAGRRNRTARNRFFSIDCRGGTWHKCYAKNDRNTRLGGWRFPPMAGPSAGPPLAANARRAPCGRGTRHPGPAVMPQALSPPVVFPARPLPFNSGSAPPRTTGIGPPAPGESPRDGAARRANRNGRGAWKPAVARPERRRPRWPRRCGE